MMKVVSFNLNHSNLIVDQSQPISYFVNMTYIETSLESKRILAKNVTDYLNIDPNRTMDSLGAACNSNKQQIYKIKTEQINPSLDFLDKLAIAMECTVQDLFTENFFEKKKTKKK